MIYPAIIRSDSVGFSVTFPDIPEAMACGATRDAAIKEAHDALETAMEFYFEDGRVVPLPSSVKSGQVAIELVASVSAKVLLLNEMISQGVRPIDLAGKLGTSKQNVQRILDLRHSTKIDTISRALAAMGKRLEMSVSA